MYPLKQMNGKPDHRYTITLEWCGQPTQQHIARYCGDWIGRAGTQAEAIALAMRHDKKRNGIGRPDHLINHKTCSKLS